MPFVAPAYVASDLVTFIHGLPHIGNADFTASTSGDDMMNYWVKSVGVLAGAVTALLLVCGIGMWIFTCCFCCKCCQRRCYCARCCCCKGSMGKIFYAVLLCLGVGSLYMGWSSREAAQTMLSNMSDAMTWAGALLDVIQLKLTLYGTQFGEMSGEVSGNAGCTAGEISALTTALELIKDNMGKVKLPISSKTVDPMIKMLKKSDTFPPDFGKIMGDGNEGLLSFAFDGMLAMIALYIMLLAFFACFANYRSKCSDKGCGRCIKCIYIFLVLVFGSIMILINISLGAGMMGTAVAVGDMCAANPDTQFADLFSPTGLVKDPEMAKVLYWTTCSGESPVSALVTAVTASADAVTNVGGTGFWDDVAGSGSTSSTCRDATPMIGNYLKTNAGDGKACSSSGVAVYCASRQTVEDFSQLFGCPEENLAIGGAGFSAYANTATPPVKVPAGGLNAVYRAFVHDALCTDMVGVFFYLWLALSASSFFILFAFCVLPCTSRNGGAKKGGDDAAEDDTKA